MACVHFMQADIDVFMVRPKVDLVFTYAWHTYTLEHTHTVTQVAHTHNKCFTETLTSLSLFYMHDTHTHTVTQVAHT